MRRVLPLAAAIVAAAGCGPRRPDRPANPSAPTPSVEQPMAGRREPDAAIGSDTRPTKPRSRMPAVSANVAPYSAPKRLEEVQYYKEYRKLFGVTKDQEALLRRNLFVCTPGTYEQPFHVYENNEYHDLASFVTVDVVLHLYHCFYDYTLRTVESEKLYPALVKMTQGMLDYSQATWAAASNPSLKGAALKNTAYFGVAARSLGLAPKLPPAAADLVSREAKLIADHEAFAVGAVFPYKIDYSQFVPRGHYTKSAKLKKFFLTMMWYGQAPFAVRFGDGSRADEPILQGLLLAHALKRTGLHKEWERIYEPTSFYVGKSDDLTPSQWSDVADRVYGPASSPEDYGSTAKLADFAAEIEKLPQPRIRPDMVLDKPMPHPVGQLRLMGQRFIPDSEVLQRLAAPVDRPFPSGLDVMAVMGSERAGQILDADPAVHNAKNWPGYLPARAKLTDEFAAIPETTWTSNLYWSWLNTLTAVTAPVTSGFPSFMLSEAWADKSLNTALASWSELRHDTILYGKQSAVECGDGEERPTPRGYVEPNVVVWDRLLALTKQSREGLSKRSLLPGQLKDRFEEFEELIAFLKRCSEKELRSEELTEEEYLEIRYIGGKLERMTLSVIDNSPQYWSLVDEADRNMAVIADVHTAPPSVLEEGVGHANEILVIVPIKGKLVLTRGAVFSHYEFTHPMGDRLTDEKWRAMLKSGRAPDPAAWTKSFLAPAATKSKNREPKESYSSGC